MFSETNIIKMLSFWLTTYMLRLVVVFSTDSRHSYVPTVLLLSLLPICYFVPVKQTSCSRFSKINEKTVARFFNLTLCYRDYMYILSLNISKFLIYPIELEIEDTTPKQNWQWGPTMNEIVLQKRWVQFSTVNFPFICMNIPADPCGSYQDCLARELLLTRKLLNK